MMAVLQKNRQTKPKATDMHLPGIKTALGQQQARVTVCATSCL